MFRRSKLRRIFATHQKDMQKDKFEKFKHHVGQQNFSNNSNEHQKQKYSNEEYAEQDEGKDAVPVATGAQAAGVGVEDGDGAGDGDGNVQTLSMQYFSSTEKDFNYVKTNEDTDDDSMDIFHRAACPIILLGQCFALMPVVGVWHANPRRLRFSMRSLQMLMTCVFLAGSSILTLAMLKHLTKIGINAKNFVGFVFFSCVQIACCLFLSLAKRWPRLMRYWLRTEQIFTKSPYEKPQRNLARRIRLSTFTVIMLAVVEHALSLGSGIYGYRKKRQICGARGQLAKNETVSDVSYDDFMQMNYDYVFVLLPYSTFVGIFILIINGACTFIWNYMDLFIMMISKGLAYRFEQITARINKLADKEVPESTFIEIREHYVKLCELLDYVDENLSGIILLSCMNNLYFVCYQLLNIFNKLHWPINHIYFWYSLLYLIGRTAFVFLSAASINDQSRGALGVLRRVSSSTWCVEVERLIFQMTTQTVALSGKKFYFLTRRLLFGMAGTIVTYELVLLQFDEPSRAKGLPDLCS